MAYAPLVMRMEPWVKEWLWQCVGFAALLVFGFAAGHYDDVEHNAAFYSVAAMIYLAMCLTLLRYCRSRRGLRCLRAKDR